MTTFIFDVLRKFPPSWHHFSVGRASYLLRYSKVTYSSYFKGKFQARMYRHSQLKTLANLHISVVMKSVSKVSILQISYFLSTVHPTSGTLRFVLHSRGKRSVNCCLLSRWIFSVLYSAFWHSYGNYLFKSEGSSPTLFLYMIVLMNIRGLNLISN